MEGVMKVRGGHTSQLCLRCFYVAQMSRGHSCTKSKLRLLPSLLITFSTNTLTYHFVIKLIYAHRSDHLLSVFVVLNFMVKLTICRFGSKA